MLNRKKVRAGAFRKLASRASALKTDERGASALEFAIFAGILAFGLLNTADISIYIYKRMQVENATEMAAQAAWKACDPSKGYLPATLSCPESNNSNNAGRTKHRTRQSGDDSDGFAARRILLP